MRDLSMLGMCMSKRVLHNLQDVGFARRRVMGGASIVYSDLFETAVRRRVHDFDSMCF